MNFLKKNVTVIILALIICPFVFLHFRSANFFLTHDGMFHIERTYNFVSSLKEGNFPPAWTNLYNQGFGSPIFLYLFPVPYIVSVLLSLLGLGWVSVIKLDFLFWDFVAAVGMYLWLHRGLAFSKTAAIIGAIFYLYSPANLSQVFVRGSLREFAGAAMFPLVLYQVKNISGRLDAKSISLGGLTLGLFLLTDGITVVMFLPIAVLYSLTLLISHPQKLRFVVSAGISLVIGFLIASYIYLPFIFEMKFLRGPTSYYLEHFVYWWQLFDYHWGFGFSLPGPNDSMSFQLGVINLLVIVATVFLYIRKRLSFSHFEKLLTVCLIGYLILIVESPLSHWLWKMASPIQLIQLPWRLLVPAVFILSIMASSLVNKLKLSQKWVIVLFLAVFLISFRYLRTNQVFLFDAKYLGKNSSDATAYHEFIPVWRSNTSQFADYPKRVEVVSGGASVGTVTEKNSQFLFSIASTKDSTIRLNSLYYPGWKALVDGLETKIIITSNKNRPLIDNRDLSGLMEINVPKGAHQINFIFTDTPIRRLGKWGTLTGLTLVLTLFVVGGLKKARAA